LSSGGWDRRNGHLRTLDSLDLGYVLLIATRCASEERTEASGQLW
jgi:hypothetical protein